MPAPGVMYGEAGLGWKERLDLIVATMREMSSQTDPQKMRSAM